MTQMSKIGILLVFIVSGLYAYIWTIDGPSTAGSHSSLMALSVALVLLMFVTIRSVVEDQSRMWPCICLLVVGVFLWLAHKSGMQHSELWSLYLAELGYLGLTIFQPELAVGVAKPMSERPPREFSTKPSGLVMKVSEAPVAIADVPAPKLREQVQVKAKPSIQYTFPAERSKLNFDKVIGMAEVKAKLLKAGREIVTASRAQDGGVSRNGIMLFGKPGNGKTFFAEALAGELGVPIIKLTFGDVASKWVNQTTESVVAAFKDAKAQAPCILFIDEIDSLLVKRSKIVNADAESGRTVNTLLTEVVDLRDSTGIVLVAATNYIDNLDEAAIREGRFDFKIEITPPDFQARKAILLAGLVNRPKGVITEMDSIDLVVKRWEGFSVARIRAIAEEVISSFAAGKKYINFELLQAALRQVQGRRGQPIGADVPMLKNLNMPKPMRKSFDEIIYRMRNVEQIEKIGGTVPSGLLFYGPPGTGKTFTVCSLAKTSGWAFLPTSGQDLLSDPERIDQILETASDLRPCIVFIDEADDVLADRQSAPWSKSVTNKLLAAIDGSLGKVPDVLFIAATNHPDVLDSAALRGGRFTEKIEFTLPDKATIRDYIDNWLKETSAPYRKEVTPDMVATLLDGNSIADIKEIAQAAVNQMAVRMGTNNAGEALGMRDFEYALKILRLEKTQRRS